MSEPVVKCPHCSGEIKLTETLAAPLLIAERQRVERERKEREAALARREAAVEEKLAAAERAKADIDAQIEARVTARMEAISREEAKKAREEIAAQLRAMQEELARKNARLAEAESAELLLRQERARLQEEKERFELEKQRAIDQERSRIRDAAFREAGEQYRLREAEKDAMLADMRAQLEEMRRRANQGSQQLQGEVQEADLEAMLRAAFPHDVIEPVPKGLFGGDILQSVVGPLQQVVGKILWEAKRTKNWSDSWIAKLKGDQREARADAAIILTAAMPRTCDNFAEIDGVWVTNSACAIPLAHAIRGALKEISMARSAGMGRQTKMELVYAYLTGPGFRRRVEAIKEAFESMLLDLESEKRAIQKQWAKREVQIRAVIENTVGLYGELQGIAGRALPEIEGLGFPELEAGEGEKA